MADTKTLIEQAYSTFNKRDIDGALALMTQDVSWPKASEGGFEPAVIKDATVGRRLWIESELVTNMQFVVSAHSIGIDRRA
jgi:hypothetical protein